MGSFSTRIWDALFSAYGAASGVPDVAEPELGSGPDLYQRALEALMHQPITDDDRAGLHRVAGACWVPEVGEFLLGDGAPWSVLVRNVIKLGSVSEDRRKSLQVRAEAPLELRNAFMFIDINLEDEEAELVIMTPEILAAFGGDGTPGTLGGMFGLLCRAVSAEGTDALPALRGLGDYLRSLAEAFPLSPQARAAMAYRARRDEDVRSPREQTDKGFSVPEWLTTLNGEPHLNVEPAIFAPDYFEQVNWRKDYRRNKNRHLVFAPGNLYESWLSHGAVPAVFRHFLCNPEYVGRAELALYLKLILLMDQRGVCYPSYDELKEGIFKQAKQISPVMSGLLRKHLILRSSEKVRIPWLGKRSEYARYVYQRPMAAYTIARLHYLGFEELETSGGTVKRATLVLLDASTFTQSAQTLREAYHARTEKEQGNYKSPARAALNERDLPPPELSVDGIREWLYRTFLTDEEQQRVKVNDKFINKEAPATQPV